MTTQDMTLITEAQMLIRKPVSEVFEAFIDPAITTNFWFSGSSGQLETGKTVTWEWSWYEVSAQVQVKEIVPNQSISIDWQEPAVPVEFTFTPAGNDSTYVVIKSYTNNALSGATLARTIMDNTGGFTTVLDGLKCWLEHGIRLNLIADKFPNTRQ